MTLRRIVACGVVVALLSAGCAKHEPSRAAAEKNVVAVTVDGQGFHPDKIPARAGEPLTLVVTRTTDETCATEILVPALGVDRKLPLHEKVEITVTPPEKGTIAFACGMDMFKGTIVVD